MTSAQDGGKVSPTHRPPLPPGNAPGTHFCQRLSRPQGHSAIGRILCQLHQLGSNQRPSDLQHSTLTTVPLRSPKRRLKKMEFKINLKTWDEGMFVLFHCLVLCQEAGVRFQGGLCTIFGGHSGNGIGFLSCQTSGFPRRYPMRHTRIDSCTFDSIQLWILTEINTLPVAGTLSFVKEREDVKLPYKPICLWKHIVTILIW